MKTPRIGITLGDPTGIGPEVVLKALAEEVREEATDYLLIGSEALARHWNKILGTKLALRNWHSGPATQRILIHDPVEVASVDSLSPGGAEAARAAVTCLEEGARLCLGGTLRALVTAPVNKAAIMRTGRPFVGQTEFLSDLTRTPDTAMMLLGDDDRGRTLRVALVTTHLPLRQVAFELSPAKVTRVIHLAARACVDLGLRTARVAVCALNPHGGEGGQLGDEEERIILPAILAERERGLNVTGPLPADSLFFQAYRGDFDVVVAMYHDQGLGPLKMIGFESGVNWTLGLPFIRTSPDHGTAYDLAGQGRAHAGSMRAAIGLARRLVCGQTPNSQDG